MTPELVADYLNETGEGPLWHPLEQQLYWTDIPRGKMFRYNPATGAHKKVYRGDVVGGFTVQADGALLLFQARGTVRTWKNGVFKTIIKELPGELDSRFNDVIADPEGRVFCGTMGVEAHPGSLYRLDPDGCLYLILDNVGISNGMGFTPDLTQFYHTDSTAREICRYQYNRATGALTNRQLFVKIAEADGYPDGMTVDAEGCVWSALWDGGALVRFSPEGKELLRVPFPARQVSCPTFAGANSDIMYVTTAGGHNKAQNGSGAGGLYRLNPGVKGCPEFLSKIQL